MKLYQLLASRTHVDEGFKKMRDETLKVFKGRDLFEGFTKTYTPKDSAGDPLPEDRKERVTAAPDRLDWTTKSAIELLDFLATVDESNTQARADLEVDGNVLLKAVPVTTLLSLESKLQEIRAYYNAIPTLDLAKKWEASGTPGEVKHGPVYQYRTAKKTLPVVLQEATKEHPAQVKEVTEDVVIGTFQTMYFSGAMHPGEKAELLARIDRLIAAVLTAREKANEIEVKPHLVGKKIFDYIHGAKGG